jgi:hypothetical protein
MPQKPANGPYTVVGASRTASVVQIEIADKAWEACEDDVQNGVISILANQPIQLLPYKGRGTGIKQEDRGLEFHTKTNKRLQAPGGKLTEPPFRFTRCDRGWGH